MATVTFRVLEPDSTAVDTALVRVYSAITGVLVAQGYTNSEGELDLLLSDAEYLVRTSYSGEAYEVVSPQQFEVAGSDIRVNLELTILDKPSATHPELCRVYGYLLSPAGVVERTQVIFALQTSRVYMDSVFLGSGASLIPDDTGYVEQDLLRGAAYTLLCGYLEGADRTVYTPDRAYAKIADVIYPCVSTVTPTSLTLTVDDVYAFSSLSVVLSDDQMGDTTNLSFTSSDESVVEVSSAGLVAVGSGTADVTVEYSDDYRDSYTVITISVVVS